MKDFQNIISSEELFDKIEEDNSNSKIKVAGQSLLAAIDDWPLLNLSEIKDFVVVLNNEIGRGITYQKVYAYYNELDAENQSWKMVASDSLLQIFEYDKTKTLEEIIIDISTYYKSK